LDNFKALFYADAGSACYNTRATCQFTAAYTKTTKTYRFYENRADAPYLDLTGYPALESVNTQPTRITPGKGLGYRASLDVRIGDFTHHDRGVDPYVDTRTYDPSTQGTFMGKFLARNKYYAGRPIRLYSGYLGDGYNVANFQEREYRIERIAGPDKNGKYTIKSNDILKALDDAVAPSPSKVTLGSAITASDTTIPIDVTGDAQIPLLLSDGSKSYIAHLAGTVPFYLADGSSSYITLTGAFAVPFYLTDSTVSDIQLAAPGFDIGESIRIRIGSELIDGTVAAGQVESATRGVAGTTAAAHAAGDSVQYCIVFNNTGIDSALTTMFTYAGIDSYINTTAWDAEAAKWLGLVNLNGTISEPEKVKDIVERMQEQGTIYVWWDERTQKIELRAIAPRQDISELSTYDDTYNFLKDSLNADRTLKDQITQVWVYHDKIDATGDDDADNMAGLTVSADSAAESSDEWSRVRAKQIYCDFVTSGSHAGAIAYRSIARKRDGELNFKFSLDAKDAGLWTGDEFIVSSDSLQDADGSPKQVRMQVLEVSEDKAGMYKYLATESVFQGQRYAFIMDATANPYASATDQERTYGAYICNSLGYMADGTQGYLII